MKRHLINEILTEAYACKVKITWYKQYLNSNPFSNAAHEAFFKYNAIYLQLTTWLDKFEVNLK